MLSRWCLAIAVNMPRVKLPVKTLEVAQATAPPAEYARAVRNDPPILTIGGRPVAVLVPIENADLETVTISTHPQFLALIERSQGRQQAEGHISNAEIRRRLGL
jgi:antitoxin (DNA-binding transcriptional repressor) of toxin-antitoxin stability system